MYAKNIDGHFKIVSLIFLLTATLVDNTIEAYTHDIDYLLNYLRNENLKVEDVKLEHLQNFAAVIYEFGIASSSQARILCGVRSFFKYLVIDRILRDDPSELLEAPSVGEHLPEVLSTEEVDRMEAAIDLSKWSAASRFAVSCTAAT